jgi:hypothetical protein
VLPAGSVATSRYVALREEGKVCSLALFGNFTYAESCILEKRFFHPSVSVGILKTSMSKTWGGVRSAPRRAACWRASLCQTR